MIKPPDNGAGRVAEDRPGIAAAKPLIASSVPVSKLVNVIGVMSMPPIAPTIDEMTKVSPITNDGLMPASRAASLFAAVARMPRPILVILRNNHRQVTMITVPMMTATLWI